MSIYKIQIRDANGNLRWVNAATLQDLGPVTAEQGTSQSQGNTLKSIRKFRTRTVQDLRKEHADQKAQKAVQERRTRSKNPNKYDEEKAKEYTEESIKNAQTLDAVSQTLQGVGDVIDGAMIGASFIPGYGQLIGSTYWGLKGAKSASEGNYLQGTLEASPIILPGIHNVVKMTWNSPSAEFAKFAYRLRYGNPTISYAKPNPIYATPTIQSQSYFKPWKSSWQNGIGQGNEATSYFWSNNPSNKFELVKDNEPLNYSVHFKTDRKSFSNGEKMGLFAKVVDEIPQGSNLSTWGSLTKGGVSGINRFNDFGFNLFGFRPLQMKDGVAINVPIWRKPFLARHSLLSNAERLGIPKGDRNNMDAFQIDGLNDFFHWYDNARFRRIPTVDVSTGTTNWVKLGEGEPAIRTLIKEGIKDNFGYQYKGNGVGQRLMYKSDGSSTYHVYGKGFEGNETFGPVGEVNASSPAQGIGQIYMTSPYADASAFVAENEAEQAIKDQLVKNASMTIPKDIMKNFWKALNSGARPGGYIANDAGHPPLGYELITIGKDLHTKPGIWDTILNKTIQPIKYNIRNNGYSTDSYLSLLKQANRPDSNFKISYSKDGMGSFNNQSFDNKYIMDLLNKANSGEIPKQQFVDEFNKWVALYNGMPAKIIQFNGKESIWMPHPFLFKLNNGGRLIPKHQLGNTFVNPSMEDLYRQQDEKSKEIQEMMDDKLKEIFAQKGISAQDDPLEKNHIFNKVNFDEYANVMYPLYHKVLIDNNIKDADRYAAYLTLLSSNESSYGTSSVARNKNNHGGITHAGKGYQTFKDLEEYSKYKINLLNNRYQAFDSANLKDFIIRLHGNNPGKHRYSAKTSQVYYSELNKMRSMQKAIAKLQNALKHNTTVY